MHALLQDLRYAIRSLTTNLGSTIVIVASLAIGIGANSAIFSVVNAVVLSPLPYPDAERIVGIFHSYEGRRAPMSGPNFYDVKHLATTLEDAAA